jgi:hypothetical protein
MSQISIFDYTLNLLKLFIIIILYFNIRKKKINYQLFFLHYILFCFIMKILLYLNIEKY